MSRKILYLARHAKSSWKEASLSDFDRPLNDRGSRDAPRMARILLSKEVRPEIIVSSPAVRAKTTAEFYHQELGGNLVLDERIYEASTMSLLYLAQEYFESYDTLMIVGHNPGLTALNDILSDKSIYNLPTASTVGILFEDEVSSRLGRQILYEYPKKYQ